MTALARIERTPATTEPVQANQWIELLAPAAELAKQIAGTEFVPPEMRNKPAAVAAAILYGAEIGIGPMQSLAKVDIVKGRPAPRAELARALALAAGHDVWVEESTNTRVKVSGRRRNSDQVQSVTWTMDDVKRAGIASQNYQKYPRQMLLARASAELVRMMCPDVLGGITMFAEEAVDAEPVDPAGVTEPLVKTNTRKRGGTTPTTPAEPPPALEQPELPDDTPTAPQAATGPTEAQIKRMMASFNDLGIRERDDRLAFTVAAIGRTVVTTKDLTVDEAARVIDSLDRVANFTLRTVWADDGTVQLEQVDDDGYQPPLDD